MKYIKEILRAVLMRRLVWANLRTALVVGTILNLINQGAALLEGRQISIPQLLLNFCVPFCVSSYSSARNEVTHQANDKPVKDQGSKNSKLQ